MKNLLKNLLGIGLTLGAITTFALVANAAITFKVVQTPSDTVYTSQGTTDATLTITPTPVDLDGNVLVMSNFGSTPTVTVDPGVSGSEEIESFTGITNNGNNNSTLTGVTRDLQSVYPYTATGTGKQHGSGAVVVFSNNPQIYGRLATLENDQGFTGISRFNIPPILNDANATSTLQAASRAYVNSVSIAGASNSSETVNGISQLATGAQAALGTSGGSTAARLVLPASLGTSTCQVAQNSVLVSSSTTGKLDGNCINTAYAYIFTGQQTFTKTLVGGVSSTTYSGSTVNIDWSAGQTANILLNQSTTITFSNVSTGTSLRVLMCQDATGSRVISAWPAGIRWATGFAPTLTTGATKCDVVSFFTATSTTSIFGGISQNF